MSHADLASANKRSYTITDLAREFDVTTRAIRFYEDEGLLLPERVGRNRVYGSRERVRLMLILRGKRLGFSLGEVKELFDIYDSSRDETSQLQQYLKILNQRRALLEQQRQDIEAVLKEIDTFERQCQRILEEKGD
ncbi:MULTISPECIES: MerR family transcriptional regulator [Leeia]|uniref:MerR family DNA-binding transcriptional regulator n=1 Tax=Leeia aquatica TaxID=2725557 RepID=A0A847S584_9NEIS|nr:MerR family DNA-binding transcriptional regulator [Leeia aquatica]NLR73945.1 MerR family DNA-binding transcriptional regulator [Leeia aquatica]